MNFNSNKEKIIMLYKELITNYINKENLSYTQLKKTIRKKIKAIKLTNKDYKSNYNF